MQFVEWYAAAMERALARTGAKAETVGAGRVKEEA